MNKNNFLMFKIRLDDITEDEKFHSLLPDLTEFLINGKLSKFTVGFDNENKCIIRGEINGSTNVMCKAQFKLFKENLKEFFNTKHISDIIVENGYYI